MAQALAVKDPEFHSLGLVLGYDYPDSPLVVPSGGPRPEPSVTTYTPSAHPGARLPHTWLPDGSSVYDLLGDEFTVLQLSLDADPRALLEAAARQGVPLRVVGLSSLPRLHTAYAAGLVLVRPDQHVAWRGEQVDDAESLLAAVTGAELSTAPS